MSVQSIIGDEAAFQLLWATHDAPLLLRLLHTFNLFRIPLSRWTSCSHSSHHQRPSRENRQHCCIRIVCAAAKTFSVFISVLSLLLVVLLAAPWTCSLLCCYTTFLTVYDDSRLGDKFCVTAEQQPTPCTCCTSVSLITERRKTFHSTEREKNSITEAARSEQRDKEMAVSRCCSSNYRFKLF